MKPEDKQVKFEEWAKVELMGHQMAVGLVSEAVIAGGAFLRVDIPKTSRTPEHTRFYSPGAVYCISPISEGVARQLAESATSAPVQRYELPELEDKSDPQEDEDDR